MYGRDYGGKTLRFEPSGGLTNASLIMQDKETDTYWSIMKGAAVAGELKGQALVELPLGSKTTWKAWRAKHPETKVLSVNGNEEGRDAYGGYFKGAGGFRGLTAKDERLQTKSPIFAFHRDGKAFAARLSDATGGASFAVKGGQLFLYRAADDEVLRSTAAFFSKAGFEKREGSWVEKESGNVWSESTREFGDGDSVPRVGGFDTYWYNWSLNNPETLLLETAKSPLTEN